MCSIDELDIDEKDYNELPGNSASNDSIQDSNNCELLPSTSIDNGEENVKLK